MVITANGFKVPIAESQFVVYLTIYKGGPKVVDL